MGLRWGNLLWFLTADSHEWLPYLIYTFHFVYTCTLSFFLMLSTSFLLPASPCGSKWCSEKRTFQALHEDIHLMTLQLPSRYCADLCVQIQADLLNISETKSQRWWFITESDTFRDEKRPPLCLVTTCSGPGRMTLLKSIWIQLWWSWADGLHILKHIRMMLYVILFFADYSVSNFGFGKQSKGSTVFLTYINLMKWSTVHFNLVEIGSLCESDALLCNLWLLRKEVPIRDKVCSIHS